MVLLIAGVFLIALGLLSATGLLLAPLGLMQLASAPLLWILFPVLCLGGFFLLAMEGKTASVLRITLLASVASLLLALIALICVLLSAMGISIGLTPPLSQTMSLWYLIVVAGSLGAVGITIHQLAKPA